MQAPAGRLANQTASTSVCDVRCGRQSERSNPWRIAFLHLIRTRRRNRRPRTDAALSRRRDHLGLDPQHPTQRPQRPPGLRRRSDQRHHLRLGQHRTKLSGKPRRLIRHQPQQPPEAPRQPWRTATTPPQTLPNPDRAPNQKPPRLKPRQHPQHTPLHQPNPLPDQHDHCSRHRPPQNPRSHSPAQPLKGHRKPLSRARYPDDIHERSKNTSAPDRQLRRNTYPRHHRPTRQGHRRQTQPLFERQVAVC